MTLLTRRYATLILYYSNKSLLIAYTITERLQEKNSNYKIRNFVLSELSC
jgi:hypothetical protein